MKKNKQPLFGYYRPFKKLKPLIKKRPTSTDKSAPPVIESPHESSSPVYLEVEDRLFQQAVADVTPIDRDQIFLPDENEASAPATDPDGITTSLVSEDASMDDSLRKLKSLIENGKGFIVADTPEYIEGQGYCDNPEITKRLHRGDFAIQGYIDLHGMGVATAGDAFDQFIKESLRSGHRAVLVVHGRGLSSPVKPVLKTKVQEWLTRGPWRKWVIAFSSARACDGGAGATYVLLRKTPYTKRERKKSKKYLPKY